MMKHYFPRFSWLQIICIAILACMLAPVAMAASVTTAVPAPGTGSFLALAGLGLGGMMLRAPADDPASVEGGGSGGGGEPSADDPKLSIGARLQAALSTKLKLAARISALESANSTLTTDLAAKADELKASEEARQGLQARIAELEAEAKTVSDTLTAAEKEIADLNAQEKDVGTRACALAKERLGSLGFPSVSLPAPTELGKDSDLPSTREELETALGKLTDGTQQRALLQRWRAAQAAA